MYQITELVIYRETNLTLASIHIYTKVCILKRVVYSTWNTTNVIFLKYTVLYANEE